MNKNFFNEEWSERIFISITQIIQYEQKNYKPHLGLKYWTIQDKIIPLSLIVIIGTIMILKGISYIFLVNKEFVFKLWIYFIIVMAIYFVYLLFTSFKTLDVQKYNNAINQFTKKAIQSRVPIIGLELIENVYSKEMMVYGDRVFKDGKAKYPKGTVRKKVQLHESKFIVEATVNNQTYLYKCYINEEATNLKATFNMIGETILYIDKENKKRALLELRFLNTRISDLWPVTLVGIKK